MSRYSPSGFTLVEMAIVLVIIGLLLGGMLVPLSAQMDQRRISETQKALDEINQALIGFAIANGRLPCPAPTAEATGSALAGLEPAPVVVPCANAAGVLPWATLGVNESDAWGNRYTYRVTPTDFARTVPQFGFNGGASCPAQTLNAAFALCSVGDLRVLNTAGGGTVSNNVPAVVVSHGKNGNGAYTSQGTKLPDGIGALADADEVENSNGDMNFVSKTPTRTFDDLVAWVSPNILFNRMVTAGKLP